MQSILTSKKNVTWTRVSSPEPEELAQLVRDTHLLPTDAEFIAQNYHRPEITVRPHYLLILAHIPSFNRETRVTTGVPLYVVINAAGIWTLYQEPIIVLEKLIQDFTSAEDMQEEYFGDGPVGLALYILNVLYASAFDKLERLYKHINIAEEAVFQGNERQMIQEVSILVRDVMDFRKVIRPQRSLFATFPSHPFLTEAMHIPWLRLHSQINKVWDLLESLAESTQALSRTNVTLLQHKENQLLQMLTYYSIVSIPIFLLLAPFNPRGPDASTLEKTVYWSVVAVLITLLGLIYLRFRGKRVL